MYVLLSCRFAHTMHVYSVINQGPGATGNGERGNEGRGRGGGRRYVIGLFKKFAERENNVYAMERRIDGIGSPKTLR